MNLLIAVVNNFTESSPSYNIRHWNRLGQIFGFQYVAVASDGALRSISSYANELSNTTLIKLFDYPLDRQYMFTPNKSILQTEFDNIIRKFNPQKITVNMDFLLFKYIENYNCQKQMFVRQFFNKIYQVASTHPKLLGNTSQIEKIKNQSAEEARCIKLSDSVITNSTLAQQNIKEILGVDSIVVPQYRDPTPFLNKTFNPIFELKKSYNVGRTDYIKNINGLRPNKYHFLQIGDSVMGHDLPDMPNTTHFREFIPIEKWYPIVENVPISLNPCIYETNGLAVQEALMMGKITLVNKDSGGNLIHIKDKENGFIVDFENDDYESFLESLTISEMRRISENAKQTIDLTLCQKSLEQYVQII